jgi:hypothetical protein
MGKESNVYKVLMGKSEGKTPLGRPMRRWEDAIRMDLRQIGWGNVDWNQLAPCHKILRHVKHLLSYDTYL